MELPVVPRKAVSIAVTETEPFRVDTINGTVFWIRQHSSGHIMICTKESLSDPDIMFLHYGGQILKHLEGIDALFDTTDKAINNIRQWYAVVPTIMPYDGNVSEEQERNQCLLLGLAGQYYAFAGSIEHWRRLAAASVDKINLRMIGGYCCPLCANCYNDCRYCLLPTRSRDGGVSSCNHKKSNWREAKAAVLAKDDAAWKAASKGMVDMLERRFKAKYKRVYRDA